MTAQALRRTETETDYQPPAWISASSIAQRYEVSVKTVWCWAKSGRIPGGTKIGPNCTRWRLSEVIDALEG